MHSLEKLEFLAARGGPFYEAQHRLGLLHERSLRVWRRAAMFVGLAWGVPFLLSAAQGKLFVSPSEGFLVDIAVWARFVLATGLFVIAEAQVEPVLRATLNQFMAVLAATPDSARRCAAAVVTALRRRDSSLMEIILAVIAIAASLVSLFTVAGSHSRSWAMDAAPESASLTLAGWWCVLVSGPLLWFLLLRGLWRHLVWALLLRGLSREDLRLVVTHPDGKAGIAFIGRYPNAYAIFVLGMSCIVGAALARELQEGALAASTLGIVMGAWLALVLALFVLPLTTFSLVLGRLKARALVMYGERATSALRLAERKLLGANVAAPESASASADEPKDLPDPSKSFEAARKMSVNLLSRSALLPLACAALLPLAIAGAGKLPYKDLISVLKKLLLL